MINGAKLTSETPKHGPQPVHVVNFFLRANENGINLITTTAAPRRASTTTVHPTIAQPPAAANRND